MGADNVQHVFSMDEEHFVRFLDDLKALPTPAGYLLSELNNRVDLRERVRREARQAGGYLALAAVLLCLALMVKQTGWLQDLVSLVFAIVGALGIMIGMRSWQRYRLVAATRALAIASRQQLEGEEGFLWRFEPFLQDWDHSLPREVRDTLPSVCHASKAGRLEDSLEALRTYWYWAAACEGRMNVAKAEMRW